MYRISARYCKLFAVLSLLYFRVQKLLEVIIMSEPEMSRLFEKFDVGFQTKRKVRIYEITLGSFY